MPAAVLPSACAWAGVAAPAASNSGVIMANAVAALRVDRSLRFMSMSPADGVVAVARLRNPDQIRPAGAKINRAQPAWKAKA